MTEDNPLIVERAGGVVRAILNRPSRRNAMNAPLVERFDALLAALRDDRTARVLVISGAGGHFCSGMDLTTVDPTLTPEERERRQLARNQRSGARFAELAALPQVVIAEIEGSAFAGGLGFVCAADIALASAEARFAAPEIRRGLTPSQILPWLAHRMGRSQAQRLVLQGAALNSEAALASGLVHEVLPDALALRARTDAVIKDILQAAPEALAETKALCAAIGAIVPDGYAEAAAAAFARCAAGPESREGIAAFKERRPPSWAG
jgi:enoyl-CoA hydratase/carnithine racemase